MTEIGQHDESGDRGRDDCHGSLTDPSSLKEIGRRVRIESSTAFPSRIARTPSSPLTATGAPYEQDYIVRFGLSERGKLAWMREFWDPTRM